MNTPRIDKLNLEMIIALTIVLVTVLGATIPLYIQANSQINAIHQEIKDFHGRLERQDAEFKAGLLIIEERMKR